MPLGCSRSSSESGNVLRHHCFLLLGSQLQAEVCKQPLDLPVVRPQRFGKSMESPSWCSQNPLVRPWLFANPSTWSSSNTSGCFQQWAGCRRCHGHTWGFATCSPELCGGSPASRRAFPSLPSFLQTNFCVLFGQYNEWSLSLYEIPGFWREATVLSELSQRAISSPLSHLEWCSP